MSDEYVAGLNPWMAWACWALCAIGAVAFISYQLHAHGRPGGFALAACVLAFGPGLLIVRRFVADIQRARKRLWYVNFDVRR